MLREYYYPQHDELPVNVSGPVLRQHRFSDFRLHGFPHPSESIRQLTVDVSSYKCFLQSHVCRTRAETTEVRDWASHIVPLPRLNAATRTLIAEEALLLGNLPYMVSMLGCWDAGTYTYLERGNNYFVPLSAENNTVDTGRNAISFYRGCCFERHGNEVLERALLCGYIIPDDLRCYRDRMETETMNKLLTYQLIMRTLLRVRQRCRFYRKENILPPVLSTVVCAYLGDAPARPWHGATYDQIWHARMLATGCRQECNTGSTEMPAPNFVWSAAHIETQYSKVGEGFWELPWGSTTF
jgi:hypothetical protein